MGSESRPLHILLFPFMAPGHMNPMVDIAKLFAARGVKVTILTTPSNAAIIQPIVARANNSNLHPIALLLIPFPSAAVGLPDGCENFSSLPSDDLQPNFVNALTMLRQPFDQVLRDLLPDCVVTDSILPWTCPIAAEHGVPRLVFHGTGFFYLCANHCLHHHKPLESLTPDADSLVLPGLPHRIEMLKSQIPDFTKTAFADVFDQIKEWEPKSYGVVVNSFYELEPDYVEHFRNVVGRKAWHVGPVSLCNKDEIDMSERGNKAASIDRNTYLKWLDSKKPGSVVYVCFGSLSDFTTAQVHEMALGLEASRRPFIWAVRCAATGDWLPEDFEERIEGRGLVVRGWAPQILILNHRAVGGFVTHCGWNSTLEGVSAGLPMVTWPLFADQFYNERLIVDVLGIGISIGARENVIGFENRPVVEAAEIERAVDRLMGGGDEAEDRRRSAIELGEKARRAVLEGGSSDVDLGNLVKDLTRRREAIETGKI